MAPTRSKLSRDKAEAHRQSLAVANSPQAKDDQDFIDVVSDWSCERGASTEGDDTCVHGE